MNKEEFEDLLRNTNNKIAIFNNKKYMNSLNLTSKEMVEVIYVFFTDAEKSELFKTAYLKNCEKSLKLDIIKFMDDEKIKLKMLLSINLNHENFDLEFFDTIASFSDEYKLKILKDDSILNKLGLITFDKTSLIRSLNDSSKKEILQDKEFLKRHRIEGKYLCTLLASLSDDNEKIKYIKEFNIDFKDYDSILLISSLKSSKLKKDYMSENSNLSDFDKATILSSFSVEELKEILDKEKEFLSKISVKMCDIIRLMKGKDIVEILNKIDDLNFSNIEKKEVIVVALNELEDFDVSSLPIEYRGLKDIKLKDKYASCDILVDLESDLQKYEGLDRLIAINPLKFTSKDRKKLNELFKICPNLTICNDIGIDKDFLKYNSTIKEYIEGEKWIEEILGNIKEEYDDFQKLAVIDNAIGKKISYSPDFETEVFNEFDCRAIWKIINSGYGICNGVSALEQYMLSRVGIESEIVSSESHAFLKLKNLSQKESKEKLTTLVDPTWNLARQRFGAKPNYFCINYDNMRQNDIDDDGEDTKIHKNHESCSDATFQLDDDKLRQIYHSVGLANDDLTFPIIDFFEETERIDENYSDNVYKNVDSQLKMFCKKYPFFAKCQNSSMDIIGYTLLDHENMNPSSRVVSRVYGKEDKNKEPLIYVYIEENTEAEHFYIANKDLKEFQELSKEEFKNKYECYEKDIEYYKGKRPWEKIEYKKISEANTLRKYVARENDER